MLYNSHLDLPPQKKQNRKKAALKLEFGFLFLCTVGLAYLSYWLFTGYQQEKEAERAHTSVTLSPGAT
jgi:hypothetical protein